MSDLSKVTWLVSGRTEARAQSFNSQVKDFGLLSISMELDLDIYPELQ